MALGVHFAQFYCLVFSTDHDDYIHLSYMYKRSLLFQYEIKKKSYLKTKSHQLYQLTFRINIIKLKGLQDDANVHEHLHSDLTLMCTHKKQ